MKLYTVSLSRDEMQNLVNCVAAFYRLMNQTKSQISLEMSVPIMSAFEKFKAAVADSMDGDDGTTLSKIPESEGN